MENDSLVKGLGYFGLSDAAIYHSGPFKICNSSVDILEKLFKPDPEGEDYLKTIEMFS